MPRDPVALITAGSAGLGAAAARLFSSSGYRVVINYSSNAERAHDLVDELRKVTPLTVVGTIPTVHSIKADLTKREDIVRLVHEVVRIMGGLDVVFSNGGW